MRVTPYMLAFLGFTVAMAMLLPGPNSTSSAQDRQELFDTLYVGEMRLYDGFERTLPIEVSLKRTGEIERLPDGSERERIDAAFLIDGEGGPYAFSSVKFDLISSRIELSYYQPSMVKGEGVADFRLLGAFTDRSNIKGDVYSAIHGKIGQFHIKAVERKAFNIVRQYTGDWTGRPVFHRDNTKKTLNIRLHPSGGEFPNPPDIEFSYTPAVTGHIELGGTKISVGFYSVDFLRRKIIFGSGHPNAIHHIFVCQVNNDKTSMDCHLKSGLHALTATGTFKKAIKQ